ncbi:MAG: hypothetical protein NUW01_10385 [Gemmatimonadaceae bacterium]|nr:hypothetical protein [Gemmatimonadaceae bacterium]
MSAEREVRHATATHLPSPMPRPNARARIERQARQDYRETVDRHLLRAERDLYVLTRIDGPRADGYLEIVKALVQSRSQLDALEGADFTPEGA